MDVQGEVGGIKTEMSWDRARVCQQRTQDILKKQF